MAWIKARWGAVILAVAIFAAGVVCGAVGQRVAFVRSFFRGPPGMMGGGERLLHRFTRDLDLTEEQLGQVRQFLEDSREQMMASRREVEIELRQLSENTHEKIVEILTDEQREQFESSSFRRFFRGYPGGPPPPRPPPPPPDGPRWRGSRGWRGQEGR